MRCELPIILILGPTAGGKTRLAIDLARSLPSGGECISADSMQVYRSMDIGTAKPTSAERAEAPHHLLDILDPAEDGFSVDEWLKLADRAITDIRVRGKWPIVVGGTNLYIQALLHGLFEGPEPQPELRDRLNAMETADLRKQLERIDPPAAERIHFNDRKRTIRAIEVFELTGHRISELQTQWESKVSGQRSGVRGRLGESARTDLRSLTSDLCLRGSPWPSVVNQKRSDDIILIGLDYPAEVINPRINARVKQMIEDGLVEEVRTLHQSGKLGTTRGQAREALGYKQIIDHLEGKCSLDEAIEQIKIKTRRYAKQQRTWLKRFRTHSNALWLNAAELSPSEIATQAHRHILKAAEDLAA